MKFFGAHWRNLCSNEGAQASTEYIILLSSVVIFFMLLVKFLQPIFSQVMSRLSNKLQNSLNPSGLYNFNFGK